MITRHHGAAIALADALYSTQLDQARAKQPDRARMARVQLEILSMRTKKSVAVAVPALATLIGLAKVTTTV